jgi:phage shock protein PspC (stress-responsive transcriptional regulator)
VAGGLGDYFNVDPALFRLAFVALTFMGGIGPVLYGLGWLFLPERETGESLGEDLVRRAGGGRSLGRWIIIGLVAAVIIGNAPFFDSGLLWAVLLIAAGVLFFRHEGSTPATDGTEPPATTPVPPAPAPPPSVPSSAPTIRTQPLRQPPVTRSATTFDPPATTFDPPATTFDPPATTFDDDWRPTPIPAPPEPPPPPSVLGRITVAAVLILGGLVALIHNVTPLEVSVDHYAALGLAVVGAGLIVGARLGRARGLIPLGIVLAVVMAVAAGLPRISVSADTGQRSWAPTAVTDLPEQGYDLGMGQLTLDLTGLELEPGDQVPIDASVGIGQLVVDVPSGVSIDLDATSKLGSVDALGRRSDGTNTTVDERFEGPEGSPTIALDLSVGMGEVEVFERFVDDPGENAVTPPTAADRNEAN